MKVIFFNYPSVYSTIVLSALINEPKTEVVAVINSKSLIKKNCPYLVDLVTLINTTGLRYVNYLAFSTTIYNIIAKFFFLPTVNQLCKKNNIPTLTTKDVNNPTTRFFLKSRKADLGVSCYFNQIFNKETLGLTAKGFINLHPSLLPKNKGVDPNFYRRLRNEQISGISLHWVSESIDSGEIISQVKVHIDQNNSLLLETYEHFKKGSGLLTNFLKQKGSKNNTMNTLLSGNYDSWPNKKECHNIKPLITINDIIFLIKDLRLLKKGTQL